MKHLLTILFLLQQLTALGKSADSVLYRITVQWGLSYSMPTGQFSAKYSNRYFLGQSKGGPGFDLLLTARAYNGFHAGLHFQFEEFDLDNKKLYSQLKQKFGEQGYYTTVNTNRYGSGVHLKKHIMALGLSYKYKSPFIEIEPYIDIALASISDDLNWSYIRRKKMNDNYSEDIELSYLGSNYFFYPGIGIRFNKKIKKLFYCYLSIQYNYGIAKYDLRYDHEDFLGNYSSVYESYKQPVSAIQIQSGVQLRIFKAKRFRYK